MFAVVMGSRLHCDAIMSEKRSNISNVWLIRLTATTECLMDCSERSNHKTFIVVFANSTAFYHAFHPILAIIFRAPDVVFARG